jgi:hypothetical protein
MTTSEQKEKVGGFVPDYLTRLVGLSFKHPHGRRLKLSGGPCPIHSHPNGPKRHREVFRPYGLIRLSAEKCSAVRRAEQHNAKLSGPR